MARRAAGVGGRSAQASAVSTSTRSAFCRAATASRRFALLQPQRLVEPGGEREVGEELRVDVRRAIVEEEPVERVRPERHRPVLEQRLQPPHAPARQRSRAAQRGLQRLGEAEMPAPDGEEDGEPLDPALGAEPGDVREVQREPHQRPQHRQRQLLLAGHPLGRGDLLRRAVEKPAVVEHHPDVGPRARAGAARGTRIDQWLMLRHLLLQERREPAGPTKTHCACARPSSAVALTPGSRTVQAHGERIGAPGHGRWTVTSRP